MPRALILYHFFYPDDVVSSRHFTDLATGLAEHGWDISALPSNRSCRNDNGKYSRFDRVRNVAIERIWRPAFQQVRPLGRVLNAIWMLSAWSLSALRMRRIDLLIVGTDPILSVLVAIPWKLIRPRTKIVHWCFDLYPEAAIADGALGRTAPIAVTLRRLLRSAYKCCDVIADIGPCMRKLMTEYGSAARFVTITPWALSEPSAELCHDAFERQTVFGDARLGLMYSGSFGRAHSCEEILSLARSLRGKSIHFAFSVRGNRTDELLRSVSAEDHNISFVPFAQESCLDARLSGADIHIVSLRNEWTGSVVPSKFFGALAAGRPVLFVGSQQSSIAHWIETHRVGWVLTPDNEAQIAIELGRLQDHPEELSGLFRYCHRVYQLHFSKSQGIDRLDGELRQLIDFPSTVVEPAGAEEAA